MKTIKSNHVLSVGFLLLGFTGSVSAIPITFDNLNGKLLSTVWFTGLGDVDYEITNNTGVTWTDFSFGIGAFLGSPFFDTSNPYPDGPGTPTLLSSSNGPNSILDVFDLNIGQGQVYDLTLRVWSGEFSVITGGPNGGGLSSHDWVSPLQSDNWSNPAAWSAPGTQTPTGSSMSTTSQLRLHSFRWSMATTPCKS